MTAARRLLRAFPFLIALWLGWPAPVWSQSIITTLPVAGSPMAVDSVTHQVYVANSSGTVTVVDGTTNATTTLQVGGSPSAIAVNPVTNMVYVADAPTNGVTVINGVTSALTTVTDPNAVHPSLVAVNATTNQIYVVNDANFTVIDGATNSTTTVAEPPGSGSVQVGIAINPVTNQVYVATKRTVAIVPPNGILCTAGSVIAIDGVSNATTVINVGPCPTGIAVNPVTNQVFVPLGSDEVAAIDAATHGVTKVAEPSGFAGAVDVNPMTNRIYVASGAGVTVIDGATLATTAVATLNPNARADAVAVDTTANTIYVLNGAFGNNCPGAFCYPGSVTVIDGATNAATTLINPQASGPRALAIDGSADRIYVANGFSNNLTVIAGNREPTSHALAVVFSGAAGGVLSSPASIDCGLVPPSKDFSSACAASFPIGTPVNLSATAPAPTVFGGWSAPCSGSGACRVTMNSDQFVVATFGTPVPNAMGLTQAAATAAITGAGLTVGAVTQASSDGVAPGNVISQNPAAGVVLAPNSAVNLVVSDDVPVPNVLGTRQSAATSTITGAGLVVGTVTRQSSSAVPAGSVIDESPAASAYVGPGAAVNLIVSSGSLGGGGAIDWLTLGGLLGSLSLGLRRLTHERFARWRVTLRGRKVPGSASLVGLLALLACAGCGGGSTNTADTSGGAETGNATVSGSIAVGTAPIAIAADSTTNTIYVTDHGTTPTGVHCSQGGADVEAIDGGTGSTTSAGFPDPFQVTAEAAALNPTSHALYVQVSEYWDGVEGKSDCGVLARGVTEVHTAPLQAAGGYVEAAGGAGIGVNPTTGILYVARGNDVIAFDSSWKLLATIPVGTNPTGVAANATTNTIYVANSGTNTISVIDGASNTVVATVRDPNAIAPVAIAVDPTTNTMYVANSKSDNLTVIDGATNSVTATIPVGTAPSGVDVDSQANFIYVANAGNSQAGDPGDITVINGATNDTQTLTDPNAKSPVAVAVNPVTHKVYVANSGSNNVTVIDGAP